MEGDPNEEKEEARFDQVRLKLTSARRFGTQKASEKGEYQSQL
jgi:hypothetical protein